MDDHHYHSVTLAAFAGWVMAELRFERLMDRLRADQEATADEERRRSA